MLQAVVSSHDVCGTREQFYGFKLSSKSATLDYCTLSNDFDRHILAVVFPCIMNLLENSLHQPNPFERCIRLVARF